MNNDYKILAEKIENIEKKVAVLENLLDSRKSKSVQKITSEFTGPKGGILLLIQEGYLKIQRNADEIRVVLVGKGYIYKREVVQTALSRLSKSTGPLVKMVQGGRIVYVERK